MLPLPGLLSNTFVTGSLAVLIGGSLASRTMALPGQLWKAIRRRLLVTVEMDSTDEAYRWVADYLSAHAKSRWFGVKVIPQQKQQAIAPPKIALHPRGFCWIKFNGRRILAWSMKESVQGCLSYRETIELQCVFGSKALFAQLVETARAFSQGTLDHGIDISIPDSCGWRVTDRKPLRPKESLCLAEGTLDGVLDDAKQFLASEKKYIDRGIPYRRGYLLYGPPGNGKTTLAQVLAGELGRNLSVLNLASVYSDEQFISLMTNVPQGNVVSIEDIDAAFKERKAGENVKITFSGLLNVLDGPMARNGQIIVITTNHYEQLDPALVRPGRVDVKVKIGNASANQARRMFRRFFTLDHPGWENQFADAAAGHSMANVQCALLKANDDPSRCVELLRQPLAGFEALN